MRLHSRHRLLACVLLAVCAASPTIPAHAAATTFTLDSVRPEEELGRLLRNVIALDDLPPRSVVIRVSPASRVPAGFDPADLVDGLDPDRTLRADDQEVAPLPASVRPESVTGPSTAMACRASGGTRLVFLTLDGSGAGIRLHWQVFNLPGADLVKEDAWEAHLSRKSRSAMEGTESTVAPVARADLLILSGRLVRLADRIERLRDRWGPYPDREAGRVLENASALVDARLATLEKALRAPTGTHSAEM